MSRPPTAPPPELAERPEPPGDLLDRALPGGEAPEPEPPPAPRPVDPERQRLLEPLGDPDREAW